MDGFLSMIPLLTALLPPVLPTVSWSVGTPIPSRSILYVSHQCLAGQGHQRLSSRYKTGPKLPAWHQAQIDSSPLSARTCPRRREGVPRTLNLFYTEQSDKSPFLLYGGLWEERWQNCFQDEVLLHGNMSDKGFPGGSSGKEPACQGRRHKRRRLHP